MYLETYSLSPMATRIALLYDQKVLFYTSPDPHFDLRQTPDPSPPPIKEPPDGPENPDVPVREPDPVEPSEI
jgi:hypothetical protein